MAVAEIKSNESNGGWVIHGPDHRRSKPYHRQRDARDAARRLVRDVGGGEIVIHARNGRIVEKQTVPRASSVSIRITPGHRRASSGSGSSS